MAAIATCFVGLFATAVASCTAAALVPCDFARPVFYWTYLAGCLATLAAAMMMRGA